MQIKLFWFLIILVTLNACASSGTIGGGPVDKTPPKLDTLRSSKQRALNVNDKKFVFQFDEFIQVKNTIKEVVVSPPLVYIPKVRSRGKQLIFEFNSKEELKTETTYIIDFGESVIDLNEGNKFNNFKYIFSTGNVIDSFEVTGRIVDLESKSGVKDVTVMLYDNLKDSIILKKKPYYSAKTNEKGNYKLQNLKKGKYRIVAIKDDNSSMTYDENTEMIGFTDKFIEWDTSIMVSQDLEISKAELTPRVIGNASNTYKGITKLKLNAPLSKKPLYNFSTNLDFEFVETKADSLILYYFKEGNIDSFKWYLPFDTLNIYPSKKEMKKDTFTLITTSSAISFFEHDSVLFNLSYPIKNIDKKLVTLKDSLSNIDFQIGIKNAKEIFIKPKVKQGKNYSLTIYPGAVQDIFGNINDTFSTMIKTLSSDLLSTIEIDLINLDTSKHYVISLEKAGKIIAQRKYRGSSKVKLKYDKLKSDEYSIVVLEDDNQNGYKDASNYWLQRQAEFEKTFKLDKLKESWIFEKEIDYLK